MAGVCGSIVGGGGGLKMHTDIIVTLEIKMCSGDIVVDWKIILKCTKQGGTSGKASDAYSVPDTV
jgi:hypothetical protein